MIKNGLFLFLLAFIIFAYFVPSYTKMQDLRLKNVQLEEKVSAITKKNEELGKEKKLLEDDPVYLERVARDKMGLVREGETVYRIQMEESGENSSK